MHIAICDDKMADRKQLERLLERQASCFEEEPLYVDSYGDSASLLHCPTLYSLFFIDLSSPGENSLQIYKKLRELKIQAPVVLLNQDREDFSVFEDSLLFHLKNPVKPDDLKDFIQKAFLFDSTKEPRIELREETGDSNYITEAEFCYAVSEGRYLEITLSNKKVLSVLSTLENLYSQLDRFPFIFPVNNKTLINTRHLERIRFLTAFMDDGNHFKILPSSLSYTKYALEEFRKEHSHRAVSSGKN